MDFTGNWSRHLLWLSLTCCVGSVAEGPNETLRAYAEAIRERRIEDAYGYLSSDARQTLSLEAFRRAVEDNPTEALEVARSLARPTSKPRVRATVTMATGEELLMLYEGGEWRVDRSAVDLYSHATPKQALTGFIRAYERKRYDIILRYVADSQKAADLEAVATDHSAVSPSKTASAAPVPAPVPAPPTSTSTPTASSPPPPPTTDSTALTAESLREAWEGTQKEEIGRLIAALKAALPTAVVEELGDSAAMTYGSGETISFVRESGLWKIQDF